MTVRGGHGAAGAKRATDPQELRSLVEQARAELSDAPNELRELARGVYPPSLRERGWPAPSVSARLAAEEVPWHRHRVSTRVSGSKAWTTKTGKWENCREYVGGVMQ